MRTSKLPGVLIKRLNKQFARGTYTYRTNQSDYNTCKLNKWWACVNHYHVMIVLKSIYMSGDIVYYAIKGNGFQKVIAKLVVVV